MTICRYTGECDIQLWYNYHTSTIHLPTYFMSANKGKYKLLPESFYIFITETCILCAQF